MCCLKARYFRFPLYVASCFLALVILFDGVNGLKPVKDELPAEKSLGSATLGQEEMCLINGGVACHERCPQTDCPEIWRDCDNFCTEISAANCGNEVEGVANRYRPCKADGTLTCKLNKVVYCARKRPCDATHLNSHACNIPGDGKCFLSVGHECWKCATPSSGNWVPAYPKNDYNCI